MYVMYCNVGLFWQDMNKHYSSLTWGKEICEVDMKLSWLEVFHETSDPTLKQELLAKSCHGYARHHLCLGFDPADSDFETSPTWLRPKHLRSELGKTCILAARAVETFMRLQTDRMMIHKLHNFTKIRSGSQDVKRGEGIECESLSIQLRKCHLDITWTSLGYHMVITCWNVLHRLATSCHVLPPRSLCQSFGSVFPRGHRGRLSRTKENWTQNISELWSDDFSYIYICMILHDILYNWL